MKVHWSYRARIKEERGGLTMRYAVTLGRFDKGKNALQHHDWIQKEGFNAIS
jgi:hypothetical protein